MRGGIPISARVFALASLLAGGQQGPLTREAVGAVRLLNNRPTFWTGSGTEQRKRRKNARRKLHNGRR